MDAEPPILPPAERDLPVAEPASLPDALHPANPNHTLALSESEASHFTETIQIDRDALSTNITTDPRCTDANQVAGVKSPLPALKDLLNSPSPVPPRSQTSTPVMPSNDNASSENTTSTSARALNVTDALSYLDAVKVQFQEKPDVYNHFLDIMKDFKSQVIDTPGVIERVSALFHGNPSLIQGFNTFLPPGYRIEMSADPLDPDVITVTTPSGTTTQNTNTFGHHSRPGLGGGREIAAPPGTPGGMPFGANGPMPSLAGPGTNSRSITPHAYQLSHLGHPFDAGTFSPSFQGGVSTTAAASFLGNLNNKNVEKQQAGEFNHAIQYLNKIKAKYSDDPDKYKNFLEILQTYQKEQRGLNDSQVYMRVKDLFKDAPDLLAEFKDFLPEITGQPTPGGAVGILPQPAGGLGVAGPSTWGVDSDRDKASKKPIAQLKRRRKPVEKDTTPVPPPPKPLANKPKRAKHHHKADSPGYSPYQAPMSPQNGLAPSQSSHNQMGGPSSGRNMSTPDELLFFDRAKKALESRETYDEFLKMLSLFSKDIIDSKTLIDNAQTFLGDGELLSQFKELMRWDDRQHSVEYGPPGSIRTAAPETMVVENLDEGQGYSYRRLPESEVHLACSGRDELARSVLNDVWISHPTWASEDAQFIAHKKNPNEDAVHACEQERHEFDTYIQANARTIAVLEPIYERMQSMTNEEKQGFRLPPDLGGPTKSIYLRIIKRIYGGAQWEEVWDALQRAPAIAVPVVLDRLHQKDNEWRREQRIWSRIWRGVEAKNYYKSLDHMGNSDYKNQEKKSITAKWLVGDIESLRRAQLQEREEKMKKEKKRRHPCIEGSVGYQLEYTFPDISVLHDSLKMVYSFLDHSSAQYSQPERRAVETFLREFIPLLLRYPETEFNVACGPLEPTHAEDMAAVVVDDPSVRTDEKLVATKGHGSHGGSPHVPSEDPKTTDDDVWIREAPSHRPRTVLMNGRSHSKKSPFFANSTYYALLRLIHLLYSRLLMCKEIGAKMTAEKYSSLAPNPIAVELGLADANGPTAVLAQAIEALGESGSREDANVLYMYLLDAWEKVFDNELEQPTLEEHMRWFFGQKAYQVFTLDKTVTGIIKQVQSILADQKSLDLRTLLENARGMEGATNRDIIRYRREAETNVGSDEHLYRVDWDLASKTMRIQLLGSDDPSVEEDRKSEVHRWREYVDSYVLGHPTEWMPDAEGGRPVYLKRSVTTEEMPLIKTDIGVQVSLGTFKLFYEAGSEDVLWRGRGELDQRALARHEERKKSRWLT